MLGMQYDRAMEKVTIVFVVWSNTLPQGFADISVSGS